MISSEWKPYKLEDLCKSISVTHRFDKKQLVFLNTGDIERGKFLHHNYSDVDTMPGQAKKTIHKNDILFSEIRPANGRYALVDFDSDDYVVSTKLMVIRANKEILPKYLYFFLTSNQTTSWLQHLAESRSGTFPQITFDHIRELDILLPPQSEQERIVNFLSALDEKIELNRQTNATLEAIAQAIFKEWFVDFNFPGATGELVESELGPIPKGWLIRSLYDSATYINGAAYRDMDFSLDKSGLPVIKINELKYGITSQTNFTNKELDAKYKIDTGELLFSWSGSPDTSLDIFVWPGGPAWLNQHIFRVLPHSEDQHHFICYLLRHLKPILIEIARDKQTTGLGHVTAQDMKRMQVLYPPEIIIKDFGKLVAPFYDQALNNTLETLALTEIRDALLPKLMSGEITITAFKN